MDLNCPKCFLHGATINLNGARRCMSCGNVWTHAIVYPQPPNLPLGAAPSRRPAAIIVAAVVGVLAVAGVAVALAAGDSAEPASYPSPQELPDFKSSRAENTPRPLPAPTPPSVTEAQIGASCLGELYETPWMLVEYRNTGNTEIGFPTVIARVTGADGKALPNVEAISNAYRLPPGESTWVHFTLPRGSTAQLELKPPRTPLDSTPRVANVKIEEFQRVQHPMLDEYRLITGMVRNTSEHTLENILIKAVGFDVEGKPCEYALAYANDKQLTPGKDCGFKMTSGTYQVSTPKTWRLEARGTVVE